MTDAYSRKIVGYHARHAAGGVRQSSVQDGAQDTPLVAPAGPPFGPGSPVLLGPLPEIHRKHGLRCSHDDGYDCYQNALAERVNGILKNEFLLQRPANLAQASQMVGPVGTHLQR